MIALEYWGYNGNLLISMPNSVICPSSFKAESKYNSLKALKIAILSGFYMYSKLITSWILMDLRVRITLLKETLKIYGRL